MGRLSALGRVVFSGRPHRLSSLGHQRNAAGYIGKTITQLTGSGRMSLYSRSSYSTGGFVEDDYEADYTFNASRLVASVMLGECANAGQESLINTAIDEMDILLIVYKDFDPGHAPQPDESPLAHIAIPTNHPEAVGLIIEKGIDAFWEYAEQVNT